jgi:hypothetical protein
VQFQHSAPVSYPGRSAYLHFREARDGASALASKASSSAHLASAACEKDDAPVHAMHRNGVRWQPADPAGAHELLEPPSRALLHRRSGEERRPSEARRTITSGLSGVPRTCRTRRDQLRPQGKRTRPGGAATSLGGLLNIRCVTTSLASTCRVRLLPRSAASASTSSATTILSAGAIKSPTGSATACRRCARAARERADSSGCRRRPRTDGSRS